jgi:hypothetical protein
VLRVEIGKDFPLTGDGDFRHPRIVR